MRLESRDLRLLVLGLAAVVLGLIASPEGLEALVGRLAPDGRIDFFGRSRMVQVRWAIVVGGVLVVALPWLLRATQAEQALEARPARPWLAVLLVAFVAASLARTVDAPPATTDAKYYLAEALDIDAQGGLLALPGRCFRAEYLESNRHPAYLALLSVVAEPSGRFTERARLVSLAGAVLALLAAFRVAARWWGSGAGLCAAALLAIGASFRTHSVAIACETWFVAVALLWFERLARPSERLRDGAYAGALAGIAWLIKGTGSLLLAATLVHLAVTRGRRAWRECALAAGAFALVALPLLWRNQVHYGQPFYNVNTSRGMWLDDYAQFRDPAARNAASPRHYLATHGVRDVAVRVATGLPKTASNVLDALTPVGGAMAFGLPVLLLALLGLRARAPGMGGHPRALTLGLLAAYLASLVWYAPVATGDRFALALVPLLLGPAGWALARIGCAHVAAATASVGLLVLAITGGVHRWRPVSYEESPVASEVGAWLRKRVGLDHGAHYALGPTRALDFTWDLAIRGDQHRLPADDGELAATADLSWGYRLTAVIVDRDGLERTGCPWARWDDGAGLVPAAVPAGWTVAARFPEERPLVLAFTR